MKVVLVRFKDGNRRDVPVTQETLTLGRRPDCDLRIPFLEVSRRHCELRLGDGEVLLKDLNSSNGTFVNGKRVSEVKLQPGDRIKIGPVVFVVQIDGKPEVIEPIVAPPLLEELDEIGDTVVSEAEPRTEPAPPAKPKKKAAAAKKASGTKPAKPSEPVAPAIPVGDEDDDDEDVFELSADDFDLEDAISSLDELAEDEDDLP